MKAMILAAGLGTRLLPLTREIAKPAAPFANRPLIHYCLDWLEQNGVREVVINLHHRPESVLSVLDEGSWPLRIHVSREENLLGTAGGLKKAERFFEQQTFVVVNGDCLFEIDLAGPLAYHRDTDALATMVLRKRTGEDPYGTVEMDEGGRIVSIQGSRLPGGRIGGYVFTGIHLLEPGILAEIPSEGAYEMNEQLYPRLIHEGRNVRGYVTDGFWAEVGSPGTYLEAHGAYLTRHGIGVLSESALPAGAELTPPVLIGRRCRVGKGARIGPSVVVGNDCHFGEGVTLAESVLWDGVAIGPGTSIRGSIVGHGTAVAGAVHMEAKVICGTEQKDIDGPGDFRR